jgi:3-hydroxyisobutyrate dehydrogenase
LPTPTENKLKLGWIGTGRMGYSMAERLAKGGCDISIWNRTRAKADPLAAHGASIVGSLQELASRDIVFCMVSTENDVDDVLQKMLAGAAKPRMVVECSSISLEASAELRLRSAATPRSSRPESSRSSCPARSRHTRRCGLIWK